MHSQLHVVRDTIMQGHLGDHRNQKLCLFAVICSKLHVLATSSVRTVSSFVGATTKSHITLNDFMYSVVVNLTAIEIHIMHWDLPELHTMCISVQLIDLIVHAHMFGVDLIVGACMCVI